MINVRYVACSGLMSDTAPHTHRAEIMMILGAGALETL
jgi:hypothetical protein